MSRERYGSGETWRAAGAGSQRARADDERRTIRAALVKRVAQREVCDGSVRRADQLVEDAVQLAEIALRRRLFVMIAVLPQQLLLRMPACMRERGLLTEQQTDDAEKLKNRALHLP